MARQIDTDVNGASVAYVDAGDATTLATAEAYADAGDATTLAAAEAYTDAHTPVGANPTATAGSTAVNGVATTFMRSDAAPAVSLSSFTTGNLAEGVNLYFTNARAISAVGGITGEANPTASIGLTAVNGTATTCMRSDGAPALDQSISPTWTGLHVFQITGGGQQILQVLGEGQTVLNFERYSNDTGGGVLRLSKSRGTIAAPLAVIQNDQTGSINFAAQDSSSVGNSLTVGAQMRGIVLEASPSPTAFQTQLQWRICASGSATLIDGIWFDTTSGLQFFGANKVIDQNRDHILRVRAVASAPSDTQGGLYYFSDINGGQGVAYGGSTTIRDIRSGLPIIATANGDGVLSKMTGTAAVLSWTYQTLIRTTMARLNDTGLLAKLLGLWVHAVPSNSTDALLNWITPGTRNMAIAAGAPTWTANQGFTGDNSTGLLTTGASIATFGASQNNLSVGCYVRTAGSSAKAVIGQNNVAVARTQYFQTNGSGGLKSRNMSATETTFTPARWTGLFVQTRGGSTSYNDSLDDAAAVSQTSTSGANTNRTIAFLGTTDTTATESTDAQISFSFIGTNLSAADIANLRAIMVDYYLVQVGAVYANGVYTVATLPAVTTVVQGTRLLVSDANATTFASTVAGGGANIVPVYNDGTNWKIG